MRAAERSLDWSGIPKQGSWLADETADIVAKNNARLAARRAS